MLALSSQVDYSTGVHVCSNVGLLRMRPVGMGLGGSPPTSLAKEFLLPAVSPTNVYLFCQIGLTTKQAVARDLFEHKDLGIYDTMFEAIVNPSGVVMVKLIPLM